MPQRKRGEVRGPSALACRRMTSCENGTALAHRPEAEPLSGMPRQGQNGRKALRETEALRVMESYDVVIAGGAVMGSSTAYHLVADPGFKGSVLVIEKDMTYQRSASALSLASIRQQFSSPVNIRISLFGISFLKGAAEQLAVDGERPEISFHEGGYLYLASEAGKPILVENQALQAAEGADILLLDPGGLSARFPFLNLEGVSAGTFGRTGEGWFD